MVRFLYQQEIGLKDIMLKVRIETDDHQFAEKIDHPDDLKEWIEWAFTFGREVGFTDRDNSEDYSVLREVVNVSFPQS